MEQKKIILPTKRFFKANEEDLSIRINLNDTENLLREGDRNIVLDVGELFDEERNKSNNYKIYGKLKMVFRNLYSGSTNFTPLLKKLYIPNSGIGSSDGFLPYNEFAFLRNDVVREVNNPISGVDLSSFNQNITLSEIPDHTLITPITAPYQNWNIYLSYVSDQDENYSMKYTLSGNTTYNFTAKDGVPFRVTDNGKYYTLISPVEHGLSDSEYITISTTGNTFFKMVGSTRIETTDVFDRTFPISFLGNETHRSEKYVINLLKSDFVSGTTLSGVVIGKRVIDKNNITTTTSQYYVHKHKTLTLPGDYILDNAGFESSIWENERSLLFVNGIGDNNVLVDKNRMESLIYDFKKPFTLSGIKNNLGYTPTDLYLTIIFKNGNGLFNYPPKVGYKFHFHNTWIDDHFNGDVSIETGITTTTINSNFVGNTFTGATDLPTGTVLIGGFVEYNKSELKERMISDAVHKLTARLDLFNHGQTTSTINFSGSTTNNPSGLYYHPHYKVPLRQLSPYIESSNTDDIYNLPENAQFFENERVWKWRDLYDPGFIDVDGFGLSHPFINNIHYIKNDINFYLRNEEFFRNKKDGITSFNSINTKGKDLNC